MYSQLFLPFLFSLISLANAYNNNGNLPFSFELKSLGYQIKDLVLTDQNFIIEAASWTIPPSSLISSARVSKCAGSYLLGGYDITQANAVFTRTYENLQDHAMIYFSLYIWLIDTWNPGDTFTIQFDDFLLDFWADFSSSDFPSNVCGSSSPNGLSNLRIIGMVPHSEPSLTLKITTYSGGSIGLRDLTFLCYNSLVLISDLAYCGNWPFSTTLICQCGLSESSFGSGGCETCSIECESCFGPSSGECYACKDGYWFDGTRCQACDSACKTCYGGENGQCSTCKPGYYLYLNTTCLSSCESWFEMTFDSDQVYCGAICPNSNEYVYPDRTCRVGCEAPYKISKTGISNLWIYNLCVLRCAASEYFLESSSECVNTCPSGTYERDVWMSCEACVDSLCAECSGAICTKCKDGAFLDNDGVCKVCEEMEVEYIRATETGPQYKMTLSPDSCDLTLSYVKANLKGVSQSLPLFTLEIDNKIDASIYIIDITLKDTVLNAANMDLSLSLLKASVIVSKQFIPGSTLLAVSKATPTVAAATTAAFGVGFFGLLSIGASAALWSMINYQQFVGSLIFINIDYPFQLELFFDLMQSTGLAFLPNPLSRVSDMIDEKFPDFKKDLTAEQYKPPRKFVKREISSFFIENGGAEFIMNFVFFMAVLIIPFGLRFRQLPLRNTLRKLYFNLKWNINARSFLESGVPISLAIFLQLRKMTFDTFYSTASAVLTIVAFLYFMVMINFLFGVLYVEDKKGLEDKQFKLKYGTLCEGLHLRHAVAKYYNIMILFRGILLAFLVTFFEDWPLLQTLPLVIYNIGLIYCLFKKVDFESRGLALINKIKEMMILVGILAITCLNVQSKSLEYYEILGWIALGLFLGAFLIELLYIFTIQILALKEGIMKLKIYLSNVTKTFNAAPEKQKIKKQRNTGALPQIQRRPRIMVRGPDGTLIPRPPRQRLSS